MLPPEGSRTTTSTAELDGRGLRVRLREEVDDAEWAELLRRDPRAHVAQSPSFLRALADAEARWLEVRDEAGLLRAGMGFLERRRGPLRTRVSGVGGTYGGPVAAPEDLRAEERLARAFSARSWRDAHVEMVWAGQEPPRGAWSGLEPLPTAVLPLDPREDFEDFLRRAVHRKRRKEARRTEEQGYVVRREDDAAAWAEFEPTLRGRAREWGIDPPSVEVVDALVRGHDDVSLWVVRDAEGRVRGVHVGMRLVRELFLWIGTTERIEHAYPATLLLREEARHAHATGLEGLNLGSSLGIDGVARFKRILGAEDARRWIVRRRPGWRRWWAGGKA